jgi:hypothetical protein
VGNDQREFSTPYKDQKSYKTGRVFLLLPAAQAPVGAQLKISCNISQNLGIENKATILL